MKEIKLGIVGTGAVFTLSHAKSIQNKTDANLEPESIDESEEENKTKS